MSSDISGKQLAEFLRRNPEKDKILWELYIHGYRTHGKLKNDLKECKPKFFKCIIDLEEDELICFVQHGGQSFYTLKNDAIKEKLESAWKELNLKNRRIPFKKPKPQGINYCRSCYDHLAGFVGTRLTETLEDKEYLIETRKDFEVTNKGWQWLKTIGIFPDDFKKTGSPFTRLCLDNTEKKYHLAGQLGKALLEKLVEKGWLHRMGQTRVLEPTQKGENEFFGQLNMVL